MSNRGNMPPLAEGTEPAEQPRGEETANAVKEKDNRHNRDINSKTIFDNAVLCAQFLRDNFDLPLLKDVQPEDIEDVSERYYPYLGTEFNADSVKRVRILGIEKRTHSEEPPFLVSLIDHKSLVDYDVSMQLLRYMVCIWTQYRQEKEGEKKDCTHRKGFRYPVIIPIVYYEGGAKWTADTHLRARIHDSGECAKWIPDFEYEVVRIHDYSDRELLEREDEMSLIMLINKVQSAADLERFIRIPPERMKRILEDSPQHVVEVLVSVIESLCFKINVSAEDRTQCVQKVKARDMGYLFENMEKIDVQEEHRKAEEVKKKAEQAIARAEEAIARAEQADARAEQADARAEQADARAEQADARAEQADARAEQADARAEKEHKRAEEAEEKLRLAQEMINQLQAVRKNTQ